MITKRELRRRERQIARLAAGEQNIVERLCAVRGELDAVMHALERAVPLARPRLSVLPDLSRIVLLSQFRQRGRPL
jgi:hypothetical protein